MSRSYPAVPRLLVPLAAFVAVFLIGSLPGGQAFRTLLIHGEETETVQMILSGLDQAKVHLHIAEEEEKQYIILQVSGVNPGNEVMLTLPEAWNMQEVRGVHATEITRYETVQQTTYVFPEGANNLEMRFTSADPIEEIAFTHDSALAALFSLTHLTLPGATYTQNVELVEDTKVFAL